MSLRPGAVGRHEASESPEDQRPVKTRYGRIVVPKGDLPGEDLVPKYRVKKVQSAAAAQAEPPRVKRKYTKRKDLASASNEETASTSKKEPAVRKKVEVARKTEKVAEVPKKEIKEEEPEMESDGEEDNNRHEQYYRAVRTLPEPPVVSTYVNSFVSEETMNESCDICGMVMAKYKIELHKLDNHPQFAPYKCLSCTIRSFWDYWELKEHYKICSNDRIATDGNREAHLYMQVVEAAFFRKLYQPVECPLCRIWLATFFDLDVHFTAHGLAAMDSKFGCDGCGLTFVSVDALKKHLTRQNTPHQSHICFNTGRVLDRREIQELMKRYSDEDRRDCIRKFDHDTYALAPPKIIECAQEATCAYCDQHTRAYAHIKTDLSNLAVYGLECSEETGKKIVEKIKKCRQMKNDRVTICRHHFQWRNWITKKFEGESAEKKGFPQILVARTGQEEHERDNGEGIEVVSQARVRGDAPSFTGGQSASGQTEQAVTEKEIKKEVMEEEEEDVEMGEALFDNSREVKKEEFDWEEMDERERRGEEAEFDIDDFFHDEREERAGRGIPAALPPIMDTQMLDEKVSASMKSGYNCPVCETSFSDLNDLHVHGNIHPERLRYACADCPASYPNPAGVFKHFDEKKKSAVAAFYSYRVIVKIEGQDE